MKIIAKLLVVALAMLVAAHFVPGITIAAFWPTAVIAAIVFGVLNILLTPVLKILTLPVNLMTLGLFTFVINALVFWLLTFLDGVTISGFVAALLGSLIVSVVSWLAGKLLD